MYWVVLFMLGFAVLLLYFKRREDRMQRARAEGLQGFARTAGLTYARTADPAAVRAIGDVQLLSRGHSRRVMHLMTGRVGPQPGAVFDLDFRVGGGRSAQAFSQTVILLPAAKPTVPDLQMGPENLLTKLGEGLGFPDIDIGENPDFSRRYVLRGQDDAGIRAALHPRATSYFAAHEGWSVELQSGNVALYRLNRVIPVEQMAAFLADASAAAASL